MLWTFFFEKIPDFSIIIILSTAGVTEIRNTNCAVRQRYTYRVLQTIQMTLVLLCVWADQAVLGSAKTALKFKYEI